MKKKNFLLAMFVLFMFKAQAQPPTPAATPTKAPADVISVFSDAYTNLSGTNFFPNWGQGTLVSDIVVSGDTIKKYQNVDYQGTNLGSRINASSMEKLHVDIWTPNGTAFQFFLINEGNTGGPTEQSVTLNPTQSGWNSFDIPLTNYHSSIVSSISQFKYVDPNGAYQASSSVFYLDNIYFWKSANIPTITGFSIPTKFLGDASFKLTAPTSNSMGAFTYSSSNAAVATISNDTVTIIGVGSSTITASQAADGIFNAGSTTANLLVIFPPPADAPSAPTQLAANVISLYSNAYTNISGINWYPNWGQSTTILDMTVAGNDIKRYDNLNYQGVEFASALNVSSMQTLHFDIWTPNLNALDFYLIKFSPSVEQRVTVNPTQAGWNSFDIPLTSYNTIDLSQIRQFKLVGSPSGSTIYLDNIYFWKSASSPAISGFNIPAKNLGDATFSITAPTSNSMGAFTYTSSNTSVATITDSTLTIVGVGSSSITASQAADGSFTAGSTNAILVVSFPPPPTAAPVPTKDPTDVLSVFSDTYTNISGTDFYPNWGQSTVVSNISIGGNTTKRYSSLNYQGVQFASPVDASLMSELHFDLWTPNCTAFEFFLINAGGVEQRVTVNPTANGWNSYDISLSQYTAINKAAIVQFKLVGTPFGTSAVYLDNIYFWKATPVTLGSFTVPAKEVGDAAFALTAPSSNSPGTFTYTSSNTNVATISGSTVSVVGAGTSTITATQASSGSFGSGSTTASLVVTLPILPQAPMTAAPTPNKPAFNVISLFSDAYTNVTGIDFFPNWGQSTQVADTMITGNTTKKYTNLNYQGIQFAGTINASQATNLHVDIWTATCTKFEVFLINTATNAEQGVAIFPTLAGWNSIDIPLSSYNANIVNHVNQIKLVGTPFGGSEVYLDNLYFWANTCINQVTAPSVSIASSANNVCAATSVMFTATPTNGGTSPNYNFIVNGTSMQNGASAIYTSTSLTNNAAVTSVITRTDGCANDATSNTVMMTIKALPTMTSIFNSKTGVALTTAPICNIGDTLQVVNYAAINGVWQSSASNVAGVFVIAGSNNRGARIIASSVGSTIISHSVTNSNGCTSTANLNINVAPISSPASITGANSVCVGSSISAINATPNGVWSSVSGRATVAVNGTVTGTSSGTASIRYTLSNAGGCSAFVSKSIVVNALPAVPTIAYGAGNTVNPQTAGGFCTNRTFTIVGIPSGGVWSRTGVINVSNVGVVTTGNVAGLATLSYTFTNSNGCVNSRTFTTNVLTCASRGTNVGLDDANSKFTYTLFPNPTKNVVNINVEKLVGSGKVIISNLFGKQIIFKNLGMGTNTIDVSTISKGCYLVSIITSDGTKTQKLIIN